MISYEKIWNFMEKRNITSYQLRNTYGIDPQTIQRLRRNQNITMATLNILCNVLQCRIEDIAEHIPDDKLGKGKKQ